MLDQQFTVSWEVIETAMEVTIGKDSDIMLTEDWFPSQDPKVAGKTIASANHQINKHFYKYHSSTARVVKDKKTCKEMTSVLGDRCRLYNLLWNWVVKAIPEHRMMEIKEWMRKMVTEQRNDPTHSLDDFTEELNTFLETKGLGTQYRTFTLPSRKQADTSINFVSAKDKKHRGSL